MSVRVIRDGINLYSASMHAFSKCEHAVTVHLSFAVSVCLTNDVEMTMQAGLCYSHTVIFFANIYSDCILIKDCYHVKNRVW
jgi:hypothetical protein